MKKKIISLISAFAILLSSVFVGFTALNIAAATNELLISDCESLTGWTKTSGNALEINNNGFQSGSKAVACNINSGAFRDCRYTPDTAIDISQYKNIEWDIMMHNGGNAGMWEEVVTEYGDEVYLKIGSSATDYNVYRLSKMTVEQDTGKNTWYHFSVEISDPSSTTGSFDKTMMSFFQFTTKDGGVSSDVRNGHIRIDNIYARNLLEKEPEKVEDLILSECESLDNWGYGGSAGNVTMTDNGMTNKALNIYTGYAALRKLTLEKSADLSKYNTIEFDMFCMKQNDINYDMWSDVTASYGDKIGIEISDGTTANIYGLGKWEVSPLGNCWYHVSINVFDATSLSNSFDLASFKSFSVYTNTTSELDTNLNTAIFRIDNLLAHYDENAIVSKPEITLSDCESLDSWSYGGNVNNMAVNVNGLAGSAVQIYTGYGALRKLTFTASGEVDLKGHHRFEFDFQTLEVGNADNVTWDKIAESYKDYIGADIGDGTNSEHFSFEDIKITPLSNGWFHAVLEVPSDSKVNLSEFKSFTFYTLPESLSSSPLDTEIKNTNFKLDNLKATLFEGNPSKSDQDVLGMVSTYFADGMMFSQNKPMNLFGTANAGNLNITAKLKDKNNGTVEEKSTTSAANGEWKLSFSGLNGGYDTYSIEIYVNDLIQKTIKNILIGELWLAAGQSNMEFFVLQTIPDYDIDLIPLNQYVRFFDEPAVPGGVDAVLPATPADDIIGAKWSNGSKANNVKYISAIAYFMSLELQAELNVPIGFINAAKGASLIESWLPREAIESNSTIKEVLNKRTLYKTEEQLENTASNWTYLTTLYNSKIAPLAGIEISGMLWYQGESNIKYAEENGYNTFYKESLEGLIDSYSKLFGFENGNMPFVCAHLAPYNYSSVRANDYTTVLASFSEMLSDVAKETSAQMIQIPIYDLGLNYIDPPINNPDPIHPNSKKDVANRFATAVLGSVYNVGNKEAANAPVADSFKVEGNSIVITFKNVGAGLEILNGGNTLHGFAICGSDRVFVKANAEITSKNTVKVWSDNLTAPVAATYAWSSFNMASNLCNSAKIPAVPYRTDKADSVYYLSMDWGYFDSLLTWDALTSLEAGYKDAYTTSENATVSIVTDDKIEGGASVKLSYIANGKTYSSLSPVLNYGGMLNSYAKYNGITVNLENPDNRTKKLSLEIIAADESYYATIVEGDKLATEYELSKGNFKAYTFNLKRIVNSEGKVLRDSATVLKTMTAINITVEDTENGYVLLDDTYLRADTLATPDSENDELVDGIVDTTAGSLDSSGNMWLSDGDTKTGWSVKNGSLEIDKTLFTQGKASVGTTSEIKTATPENKKQISEIAFLPGISLDISGYDYLEFDMYVSNMEWFNASPSVMFELTSAGAPDNESNRYMKGYLRDNASEFYAAASSGTDTGAWYHIKLILNAPQTTARGGLDVTRFNYFRFYAIDAPATIADFTVRFDNMKFTKEGNGEVIGATDPSYGKVIDDTSMWLTDAETLVNWSASVNSLDLDYKNKTQGNSAVTLTASNGLLKQVTYSPKKAIDISDYQFLEFDVYFSNLDWFKATNATMFELTSAGTSDKESNRYTKSSMLEASSVFAADVESGNGGGKWYHFKLNLDRPHTSVKGGLNKEEFDFFRFYTVELKEGTPDYTMLLDNLRFTKGEKAAEVIKTDSHIIINNGDSAAGWTASGAEVMFDSNNKTEGKGSVTVTAKNGILKELAYRPSEAIDLTGYHYLQFDLFLSDLSFFNTSTGLMVELTSSGKCDEASNRYMKSAILLACPELASDISNGIGGNKWYSFCFNLDKPQNQVRGGMDSTAFNFFRIYFIGSPEGTPDCVVNIDNLRVTKEGVSNVGQSGGTAGGQTTIFGSSSSVGKNVGNKVNGGLLAEPLTVIPEALVTAVYILGAIIALAAILVVVLLIINSKIKKR